MSVQALYNSYIYCIYYFSRNYLFYTHILDIVLFAVQPWPAQPTDLWARCILFYFHLGPVCPAWLM